MSGKKLALDGRNGANEGLRLDDKVAIVSGAGIHGRTGIGNGAATVVLFAERGATVVLVDEKREWVEATREKIEEDSNDAIVIQADVTDSDNCRAVVEETVEEFDRLDVLHNNMGRGPTGKVIDADMRRGSGASSST